MAKIRLDIDELINVLSKMKEDGFVTTEIMLDEAEEHEENELSLSVIDIENDEVIHYANISNFDNNL